MTNTTPFTTRVKDFLPRAWDLKIQLPARPSPHPPNSFKERHDKAARRAALVAAFQSRTNKLSLRKLSKHHGISFATAHRLVHGKTDATTLPGRTAVLPADIEGILVNILRDCAAKAVAIKMSVLPSIIVDLAKKYGHDCRDFVAGEKWMTGFFGRYKDLAKRLPSKTNQARLVHWNRVSFARWSESAGPLAAHYSPEETWNMDDTSFDLETVKGKVSMPQRPRDPCATSPNLPRPFPL